MVKYIQKEYGSPVHFLYIFMRFLKSISDEWFNEACWSSLLFGISPIKKCVQFSLTSLHTLKYDCVMKTIEIFDFIPLINNLVTTGFNLLLLIISAIILSKTINILCFLPILYSSIFFINILSYQ